MPGYRLADVDKNNIDAKYFCGLCSNLVRDAFQTTCGHFCCESCLQRLLENDSTPFRCIKDGKVIHKNQIFKDEFMRREILALVVSCTFQDEGCTWRGEVRHFEDHKVTCESMRVPCVHEACGLLIKRGDLAHHLATECSYRLVKCQDCDAEISCNLMKEHLRTYHDHLHHEMDNLRDVVDDFLHVLENLQEGQRDLQEGQRDLQEGQRNLQEGQRHLQEGQRDLQEGQRDLQEGQRHLQEGQRDLPEGQRNLPEGQPRLQEGQPHLREGQPDLQEGQPDLREGQPHLQEGQRHLQDLQNRQDDLQSTFQVVLETLAELVRSHDDQKMELDLLNDKLANPQGNCNKALQGRVKRLERRIESPEVTLAFRNLALADLEGYVKQQEFSSYDGQLLWKISDYARRRNDAVTGQQVSLYSPCFYTSRHGYKMCARLYLNGDGIGKGTHISIFFVVMRGHYDALLRWPFRQKVTFMLLDQDNVEHVIDAFRPDSSSPSFQRPRRETNISSGCPMFCPLAELNNRAYVRDDTMFLKVIVDTSDL